MEGIQRRDVFIFEWTVDEKIDGNLISENNGAFGVSAT